jgi:DNA-3-methyladenine glycosylase II
MRTQMRRRALPYDAAAARRHLMRADPVMRAIVKQCGPLEIEARGKPYEALIRSILYQQLAGPAAAAIERRFLAMFGGAVPPADRLAVMTDEHLREAGISRQKASYFRSIGELFASGALSDRKLLRANDDHIVEAVTQIRGVGRWTADMLLMFCIGRPDVLPVGDLGIQNAMKKAYGVDGAIKPERMIEIAEPWRPYRSAGSWYLWRSTDILTL